MGKEKVNQPIHIKKFEDGEKEGELLVFLNKPYPFDQIYLENLGDKNINLDYFWDKHILHIYLSELNKKLYEFNKDKKFRVTAKINEQKYIFQISKFKLAVTPVYKSFSRPFNLNPGSPIKGFFYNNLYGTLYFWSKNVIYTDLKERNFSFSHELDELYQDDEYVYAKIKANFPRPKMKNITQIFFVKSENFEEDILPSDFNVIRKAGGKFILKVKWRKDQLNNLVRANYYIVIETTRKRQFFFRL